MSQFLKMELPEGRSFVKDCFSWKQNLHNFERGESKFVPVRALMPGLTLPFKMKFLKKGKIFETIVPEYENTCKTKEYRWLAKIKVICGYRVLAQWLGSFKKFWINILSENVYYLGEGMKKSGVHYIPPPSVYVIFQYGVKQYVKREVNSAKRKNQAIEEEHEKTKRVGTTCLFQPGMKLELLNYYTSTNTHRATVMQTCGRRLQVQILPEDYPLILHPDLPFFRQVDDEFWVHDLSFFLLPTGFSALENYRNVLTKPYRKHCRNIAEAITKNEKPDYDIMDSTFEKWIVPDFEDEDWDTVKVGQKLELLDPLSAKVNSLHVASVLSLCRKRGYIIVGIDGPNVKKESLPLPIDSEFIFPVGYAETYGLQLETPEDYEGKFDWDTYLEKEKAKPLEVFYFKKDPVFHKKKLSMFQVGMKLEAASQVDRHFIGPATIKSIHGRILRIGFDGWGDEHDELYDIRNHDLLPIGWCEIHGYDLRHPPKE